MHQLAIVIPAYKDTYFAETLESLANQTDKRFTVYIGDDCSPNDLEAIVNKYTQVLDIKYHRFPENLGGKDLVGQWERCIDLTHGEPWLWLFSDDDRMSPEAVETVLKGINSASESDLLHLNLDVVDKNGKIMYQINYPTHITNDEFYIGSLTTEYKSFVVEFIFNRNNFYKKGRFHKCDLAWGSDGITWLKLSKESGITTMPEGRIYWRYSGENISSKKDRKILWRKYKATVKNFLFLFRYSKGKFLLPTLILFMKSMKGDLLQIIKA